MSLDTMNDLLHDHKLVSTIRDSLDAAYSGAEEALDLLANIEDELHSYDGGVPSGLVHRVQELIADRNQLDRENDDLRAEVERLKEQVKDLEYQITELETA